MDEEYEDNHESQLVRDLQGRVKKLEQEIAKARADASRRRQELTDAVVEAVNLALINFFDPMPKSKSFKAMLRDP